MVFRRYLPLGVLFILGFMAVAKVFSTGTLSTATFNWSSFPASFIFGTASASYQYEGAADENGRGPSIWDTYTHRHPEKIADKSNGDVAVDAYNRYREDVGIMKEMNLDAYRFSISWTRILPNGKLSGGVNQEGINYYSNLINELLNRGIQPFVTLFHWDLPQALEDEYGGFLSPRIVSDFQDFAEVCFKEYGDRVKHWITLNEPLTYSMNGYASGIFAPGRCSGWMNASCVGGDSGTEPYIVSHNQLLAHAAAVNAYKTKYQASQKGLIGIALSCHWFIPHSDDRLDHLAAQRAIDFMLGWFMEPLSHGEYPRSMQTLVGNRLPKFSNEQSQLLSGSFDFIGLNYYTALYAVHASPQSNAKPNYFTDSQVMQTLWEVNKILSDLAAERNGILLGPQAGSTWLYIYPSGIQEVLLYIKEHYNNPLIHITENGVSEVNDPKLSLEQALNDTYRMDYHYQHLSFVKSAIKNGVRVEGYFAWSLLDNFEWNSGYTVRFGINFVDFENGLKRYPKLSAHWFKDFLKKY